MESLLSTKQTTEPPFRLGSLLLDGLIELVDGRVELLARLLELLVGTVLEGVHLGLGPLRFGFCVIGLGVLARVPMACEELPGPIVGRKKHMRPRRETYHALCPCAHGFHALFARLLRLLATAGDVALHPRTRRCSII
jgi:hypothetical protein